MQNREIAGVFEKYATLLEIQDANPFRVRAYHNAAESVRALPRELSELIEDGADLTELHGIGDELAAKIHELVETGALQSLQALEREVPGELAELTELSGLGPKRVAALFHELDVRSTDDLEQAARAGQVSELDGFGEKTEQKILDELERQRVANARTPLPEAERIAEPLLEHLRACEGVKHAIIAGSYRRRRATVGDLDVVVTASDSASVMKRFTGYDRVAEVVSGGTTRSTVILEGGLQVDLRVVPEASYGAALYYFTGSKAHNVAVRTLAVRDDLKINEYGVYRDQQRLAGETEAGVFEQVGLAYIEPELRENRGEIEAAAAGKLPALVERGDLRGDLHSHTDATDGHASLRELAEAAAERGYDYLAITDHSQSVNVANGLDADRLLVQLDAIDELNESLQGLTLLKSCEVDILEDGSLDLPDAVLGRLDLTVCAIHSGFELSARKQTRRILRAMDNPRFTILAHPTCRLIGKREPIELDTQQIMEGARERGCILEVNAQPRRLDLDDVHCKMAHDLGVKLAISTDAHAANQLDCISYGVDQARRGWLESGDVVNTLDMDRLHPMLRR